MANRRTSFWLQAGAAAALGCAWLLARAIRNNPPYKDDEPVYALSPLRCSLLSAVMLLADFWAIPAVLRGKAIIDTEEAAGIQQAAVPWIDRHALSFNGAEAAHYRIISDRVLMSLVAMPFLLLLKRQARRDWRSLGALYAWGHALSYTIYSFSPLGPAFVDKYRPVVYYTALPEAIRNPGNNRNARFSGHTANGACAAFFLAKVYNDYHPRSTAPEKGLRYLLAFGAPLLLGWLRMRSLKHFPSDVIQAVVIGGACGVAIPELYRRA